MEVVRDDLGQRGEGISAQMIESVANAIPPPPSPPAPPTPPPPAPKAKKKWWPLLVIGIITFASLIVEIFAGKSICASLRQSCAFVDTFMTALVPLFRSASVSKIAETIGVCSVLIGWIYASLDKTELGVRYSKLVELRLRRFHIYVVVHFVGVLLCIWLSTAKMVESAVLVLLGILYNSWLQWGVLYSVVLSSQRRRNLSMEVWRDRTVKAENAKSSRELALEMAAILAEKDMGETLPLQEELVKVLLQYERQCWEEGQDQGLVCAVEEISWIFGYVFRKKQRNERVLLSRSIFSYCKKRDDNCGALYAGYALWLITDKNTSCEQAGKTEEAALKEARNALEIVARGNIQKNRPEILRNWRMVFVALALILFQEGTVKLDRDLMKTWEPPTGPCPDQDRILLWAAINAYFGRSVSEDIFSTTISIMWTR